MTLRDNRLTQPCGCISQSIHPVSIRLHSHPWCLSKPHPQNRYQYLTPPLARSSRKHSADVVRPAHHPACAGTGRGSVHDSSVISLKTTRCHCTAGPWSATALHRFPAARLSRSFFLRGACHFGISHPSRRGWSSPKAGYELCISFTCKERALTWVVSPLSTCERKLKYMVLHMGNSLWHGHLWFLPSSLHKAQVFSSIFEECTQSSV